MNAARNIRVLCACALVVLAGCSVAPEPLTKDDFELIAVNDREQIFDSQEVINETLTLELAMSMALKYNLENRVRLLEESVANQQLDMTKMDLLPSLAANAGYLDRDNVNASSSVSVESGLESLEPSTSQDQEQFNGAGTFTWNLLDFGVSYLQAKQDADRYLIAQKAREKVMMSLLKEVRASYWKAVAMEQMRGDLNRISTQVDELLEYWQSIREQQLRAPVAVLMDIRSLIETRQQLDEIQRSIDTAQARLANLINAPDFRDLVLPTELDFPELPEITDDIDAMELVALSNSADYASEVYKVRIEQLESRKAMVRLLPGIEFSYGANYDDNSFLVNNHWGQFGVNLTGDLTQLFFTKQIRKFRDTNEQLTINRKLAINMAVITGVHITWQDYRNSITQYERAQYLQEIDEEISKLTRNAEANQAETGAAAIQSELRAFRSRISQMQSYADAQEAFGALMVSLGINPIPLDYQQRSVKELSVEVASSFDSMMFPYTKEGERILAEKQRFDRWVEEQQTAQALAEERELRLAEAEAARLEAERLETERLEAEKAEAARQEEEAERQRQLMLAEQEAQKEEVLELAVQEEPQRRVQASEPVVVSAAPDMQEFLTDFWDKYFPTPDLKTYLKSFIDGMPEGPNRDAYLKLFLEQMEK